MCTGRSPKHRFGDDELVDKTGTGLQGLCFDSAESREREMLQSMRTRQPESLLHNRTREPEVRNLSKRLLSSWRSSSKLLCWKTQSSQLKSGKVPHTNLQPHCRKTKCARRKTRLISKSSKRCWTTATNTSQTLNTPRSSCLNRFRSRYQTILSSRLCSHGACQQGRAFLE